LEIIEMGEWRKCRFEATALTGNRRLHGSTGAPKISGGEVVIRVETRLDSSRAGAALIGHGDRPGA